MTKKYTNLHAQYLYENITGIPTNRTNEIIEILERYEQIKNSDEEKDMILNSINKMFIDIKSGKSIDDVMNEYGIQINTENKLPTAIILGYSPYRSTCFIKGIINKTGENGYSLRVKKFNKYGEEIIQKEQKQ